MAVTLRGEALHNTFKNVEENDSNEKHQARLRYSVIMLAMVVIVMLMPVAIISKLRDGVNQDIRDKCPCGEGEHQV